MTKKVLLIIGVVAVAAATYLGMHAYNARMPIAAGHSADLTTTATELLQAFEADEVAAGRLYNDKLVQVKGTVRDVSISEGRMNVSLGPDSSMGSVVCAFNEPAATPAKGSVVSIKGYCAGFNFDVLLQRCAFVEERP